jgi:signal transduction histidine kinase
METSNISLIGVIIPITLVVFIISIGVVLLYQHYQKNLYRQKLEQESLKGIHQQELLRNSLLVQEEERKRIASDLHDELGATLSILRMHLVQAAGKPEITQQIMAIGQLIELSNAALSSVRQISHQLMPPQLENFGLIKTLESVINGINSSQSVEINLSFSMHWPSMLAWPTSLGLYRVVMELLQNSLKHAHASTIWITFDCESDWLSCHYRDDGSGLPPELSRGSGLPPELSPGKGMGLKNMEARAIAMDGVFTYANGTNGGFTAVLKIHNHQ